MAAYGETRVTLERIAEGTVEVPQSAIAGVL
jgi:hypothetical protein